MTNRLLMGNEAFAHAALAAGVRVVAGYPGTPSSELIETVARERAAGRAEGVHVEWSTNEKAALELLAGAAYAGARTLFTCKQVGLNVASDALMSLNYIGVKGGMVLFVADDPGPISSQTEQDTRRFASFAKVPVFDPSTPEEGCRMMEAAFELSERYGAPVVVRPTTRVNHASEFIDVPDETHARPVPPEGFERDPRWIIFPRRAWQAHGEIVERLRAIADEFSDGPLAAFNPQTEGGEGAGAVGAAVAPRLGIVAGGVSAAYVREALRMLADRARAAGLELPAYRLWQVGTPYPFPEKAAARFAEGLERAIVFEELDHVIEDELWALAGKARLSWEVHGKLDGSTLVRGENSVDDAYARLAAYLVEHAGSPQRARMLAAALGIAVPSNDGDIDMAPAAPSAPAAPVVPAAPATGSPVKACAGMEPVDVPLPVRPPVLCPGCPHRGSFYAVKRALGKAPSVLCGDIGCYTLGNAQPLDAIDTCLCMGAGITMAQGFAVAEPGKKCVAFVGDSTFFASGLTGIANAVYNQHDITVVVLDNATTAMTGSQPHPGTGVTLMGPKSDPIDIEGVLRALGVRCVVRADPFDLDGSIAAAKEAIEFEGPSALLFVGPCVTLSKPAPALAVDSSACTGCRKCIAQIGCPAIAFDTSARGPRSGERGQAFVDPGLCNGCGLCAQVCPFDALGGSDD